MADSRNSHITVNQFLTNANAIGAHNASINRAAILLLNFVNTANLTPPPNFLKGTYWRHRLHALLCPALMLALILLNLLKR